jgi:hypothetical protein
MIESANQQGLTSAAPSMLWKHSTFAKEMIRMLATAQL